MARHIAKIICILASLSVVALVAALQGDASKKDLCERGSVFSGGVCRSGASLFSSTVSVLSSELVVRAGISGLRDPRDRHLYKIEGSFLVEYTLTNLDTEARLVGVHQTPLSNRKITYNLLSRCSDLFHVGIISHDIGEFNEYILVEAGAMVRHTFDLGPTTAVAVTSGTVEIKLGFLLRLYDTAEKTANHIQIEMRTDGTHVVVAQAPAIHLGNLTALRGGRRARRAASSIEIATSGYRGVPYWQYACYDDGSRAPYTCGNCGVSGDCPCTCAQLSFACTSDSVKAACPFTCGNQCAALEAQWTKPWLNKSYTTIDAFTANELSRLQDADRLKDRFCATALFCLENRSFTCEIGLKKWFGGTFQDTAQVEILRKGFTKMCSATNYIYVGNPTIECEMSFEYSGQIYTNVQQSTVPASVRNGFISECNSPTGCPSSYAATIAWVSGSDTFPRKINLCPIGIWIQKDIQDATTFDSMAGVLIHELLHFVDIADTDDMSYDNDAILAKALTDPWYYIKNSQTWDSYSEDDVQGMYTWGDFSDSIPTPLSPAQPPTLSPTQPPTLSPAQSPTSDVDTESIGGSGSSNTGAIAGGAVAVVVFAVVVGVVLKRRMRLNVGSGKKPISKTWGADLIELEKMTESDLEEMDRMAGTESSLPALDPDTFTFDGLNLGTHSHLVRSDSYRLATTF